MRKSLLFLWCTLLYASSLFAQNVLPIGYWRAHLPYHIGQSVTQSDDEIYYATELSLTVIDKEERSARFMSTIDGLSNTGIQLIKYIRSSEVLMVVYNNSVIDLVRPDGIVTLNQIRNFTSIIGEKRINDIFVENDSIVYLAASFGVSKLNVKAAEFSFTTFTGLDVRGVCTWNGHLYASTTEGLYRVRLDAVNPADFSGWEWLGQAEGFPIEYSGGPLAVFNNELYAGINDTLCRIDPSGPAPLHVEEGHLLYFLSAEGPHLLAGFQYCPSSNCVAGKVVYLDNAGNLGYTAQGCVGVPNYAVEDQNGRIWFGDRYRQYRLLNNIQETTCTYLDFNSPFSERAWEMAFGNNQLWVAAGALDQTLSGRFITDGFFSFIDGQWVVYNRETRVEMRGENPDNTTTEGRSDDLFDIITIAVHPENGKVYAGSFLEGIMEVDGDRLTLYNENNSTLEIASTDQLPRVKIGGLAFDAEGNLWVSNHSAAGGKSIAMLGNDGQWRSFSKVCNQDDLYQVAVDESNNKWVVIGNEQAGVLVFNENELDDDTDDECRTVTTGNSSLPTNTVNCVSADLDGDVWVGTSDGVVIFECGSGVFEDNCRGTRRIVKGEDGFNAYLLESENVLTIAVDGANRKWVGTSNGAYLLSPSGEEQILRFTTANSPLFDDVIYDIVVDQITGEVFFGTAKGILSYQGDAVAGGRFNKSELEIYPNPVRADYEGPIAINGLARDANVKITDLGGRLVYETQALGGQAVWDGRDYNGRRANSGVYLVFATTNPRNAVFEAKPSKAVAKIVLLN